MKIITKLYEENNKCKFREVVKYFLENKHFPYY